LFFNPDFPGKQLIKPLGERRKLSEKRVKQVFAKVVKRDKAATKTLKKSNILAGYGSALV